MAGPSFWDNQEKAQAAFDEIMEASPDASLEIVELDLGSQESTTAAAAAIAGLTRCVRAPGP